jgi:hypothetical protein
VPGSQHPMDVGRQVYTSAAAAAGIVGCSAAAATNGPRGLAGRKLGSFCSQRPFLLCGKNTRSRFSSAARCHAAEAQLEAA